MESKKIKAESTLRYAVAVDGSKQADGAFHTALYEAKLHKATLYVVSVVETMSYETGDIQKTEKAYRNLLSWYEAKCVEHGVASELLLGTATNVGKLLVEVCKLRKIDCLVVGRRGLSGIKRLFMGSVSSYCVEHAPCNVLVQKHVMVDELHVPVDKISEMEEAERQHRLKERQEDEVHADKAAVLEAEEKERQRRIEEDSGSHSKELDQFRAILMQNAAKKKKDSLFDEIPEVASLSPKIEHIVSRD